MTVPSQFSAVRKGKERTLYSPSVRVRAMRNRENGGRCNLAFNVANTEARMTNGATILNTCTKVGPSLLHEVRKAWTQLTNNVAIENGLNIGISR